MRSVLYFALILPLFAESPAKKETPQGQFTEIRPTVEKMISEGKLAGGSVLIIHQGKTVYHEQFGYRDLEKELPVEKDTLFRIYSMTKGLASTAALMLCEEGKMSLDDPVENYLPKLAEPEVLSGENRLPASRSITVRDLLRHTSGYGNSWQGPLIEIYRETGVTNRQAPLSNMISGLSKAPLLDQPGNRWVYGISTDVLAAVVAQAAGKPFEQVLQERLLTPLGMIDTFYQVPADKAHRLAVHYRIQKGQLRIADSAEKSNYLTNPRFKGGGSGLVSTTTDYAKFLQMIANGGTLNGKRYLREDSVDLMRSNQLPRDIPCISFGEKDQRHGTGFGLGFSVKYHTDDRWDPHAPVGEYGWGGAASTHYWISPKHQLIVITMEQTMPYNWNLEHGLKPIIYAEIEKTQRIE
jgi:CubicO group peptidase (beta-lactamase class C family)